LAERVPARLTPAEGRKFALPVGTAFLALGGLAWWRGQVPLAAVLGALGGVLWVTGLAVPARLGPVQRLWMALAHAISRVTTPVFLGIVYFLVIMPVGVLMRLFGRNPVRHRPVNDSYWAPRVGPRGGLTNQF